LALWQAEEVSREQSHINPTFLAARMRSFSRRQNLQLPAAWG
jgi:hypothetical protein